MIENYNLNNQGSQEKGQKIQIVNATQNCNFCISLVKYFDRKIII